MPLAERENQTDTRRLLLLVGCAVALCAPSSMAAGVPVATRCSGTVKVGSVTAGSIRTTKVSCTKGKTVIRSLLAKAASSSACRRAADRPAPSTGCVVSGYHCFRKLTPDYCATTSGKLVQWRESHLLSGKPPR